MKLLHAHFGAVVMAAVVALTSVSGCSDAVGSSHAISANQDPNLVHDEKDSTSYQDAQEGKFTVASRITVNRAGNNPDCHAEPGGTLQRLNGAKEPASLVYVRYSAPRGVKLEPRSCRSGITGLVDKTAYDKLESAHIADA